MSAFSHGLFARQVPCETVVRAAVQKLLSFWTAPSLVALSPSLRDDPTAGAGGISIRTVPTFVTATVTSTGPLDKADRAKRVLSARPEKEPRTFRLGALNRSRIGGSG